MKTVFIVLLGLFSAHAHAIDLSIVGDTTIGNGGDLVSRDMRIYLLDLFEAGIEKNPYFDDRVSPRPDILARVRAAVSMEPLSQELLAHKLTEIRKTDALLGESLLRTAELLRWRFVNYELANVPDEGTTYKGELFQGAIRQGLTVFLQQGLWREMTAKNRSALILHELIYALYKPEPYANEQKVQRSYRVREINALIHTPGWNKTGLEEFYRVVDRKLPLNLNRGLKPGFAPDQYFTFPKITVIGATGSWSLKGRNIADFDEGKTIEDFCKSIHDYESYWGKSFYVNQYVIEFGFKRSSYVSPLGLLDFVEWRGPAVDSEFLQAWKGSAADHWQTPWHDVAAGSIYHAVSDPTPDDREKAKSACADFMREAKPKYEHSMDDFE